MRFKPSQECSQRTIDTHSEVKLMHHASNQIQLSSEARPQGICKDFTKENKLHSMFRGRLIQTLKRTKANARSMAWVALEILNCIDLFTWLDELPHEQHVFQKYVFGFFVGSNYLRDPLRIATNIH